MYVQLCRDPLFFMAASGFSGSGHAVRSDAADVNGGGCKRNGAAAALLVSLIF